MIRTEVRHIHRFWVKNKPWLWHCIFTVLKLWHEIYECTLPNLLVGSISDLKKDQILPIKDKMLLGISQTMVLRVSLIWQVLNRKGEQCLYTSYSHTHSHSHTLVTNVKTYYIKYNQISGIFEKFLNGMKKTLTG